MPRVLIPPIFTSYISMYHWHSLVAKSGDDDLFSSDIDDEMLSDIFAGLTKPTLIMSSENDEMVPQTVNKVKLIERWMKAAPLGVVGPLSEINPGADHESNEESARTWFVERVLVFFKGLE